METVVIDTQWGQATVTVGASVPEPEHGLGPLLYQLDAWRREWRRVWHAELPPAFRRECERLASRMADWEG